MRMDNVISPIEASMMLDNTGVIDDTSYLDFMSAGQDKNDFFKPTSLSPDETQMRVMSGERVVQNFFKPEQTVQQPVSNIQRMTTGRTNDALPDMNRFSSLLKKVMASTPAQSTQIQPTVEPTPAPVSAPATETKSDELDWTKFFSNPTSTSTPSTTESQPTQSAAPAVDTPLSLGQKLDKFFAPEEKNAVSSAMQYTMEVADQATKIVNVANAKGLDGNKFLSRLNSIEPEELVEIIASYDRAFVAQQRNERPVEVASTYRPDREIPGVSIAGVQSSVRGNPSPSIFGGTSPVKQWGI